MFTKTTQSEKHEVLSEEEAKRQISAAKNTAERLDIFRRMAHSERPQESQK